MAKISGMGMVKSRRMMMMRRWEMKKILMWILHGKCYIARAIVEKIPDNTMEKVKIYSALGEVALEREDIDNSLSDYMKALAMLEQLVEPDHHRTVELNFHICLVYELAYKIGDAIPYHGKSAAEGGSEKSAAEAEVEQLTGILTELEKKLEDLEQAMSNPNRMAEIMKAIASRAAAGQKAADGMPRAASFTSSQMATSSNGFDSSVMSTAGTTRSTGSTVTDLGVVGRGVKRANIKPISAKPALKMPVVDSASVKGDSSNSSEAVTTTQNGDESVSK
ncbi:unnamed protein product [Urochloa decumbens]|uniref:Tetratricopeptide repeat (TPR)-like superfamily protein n=1 Tax=Urochloa decumbens TaxID=240449 RepID=A0ABC9DAZ7_9POAL